MERKNLDRRNFLRVAGVTTSGLFIGSHLANVDNAFASVLGAPTVIDTSPADKNGEGKTELKHWQSGEAKSFDLPEWFLPHRSLRWHSDYQPAAVDLTDLEKWDDFEFALNTRRPEGPLAGYSYDENDFSRAVNPDSTEQLQAMMRGWTQLTGRRMTLPGIGHIEGAHRIPVVFVLANRASNIHKWDAANPVMVESGFMSEGRIWDANDPAKLVAFESAMVKHKLSREANGTGDGKFEGVGDHPDNAVAARVVTVQRRENKGENTFQFIRAQEFKFAK